MCRCAVLGHRTVWDVDRQVCTRSCCRGRERGDDVRGGAPLVLAVLDRLGWQPDRERPFLWHVSEHVSIYYPAIRYEFGVKRYTSGDTFRVLAGRLRWYWDRRRTS